MLSRRLVAAAVSALVLAAPVPALAQSAGDQQYQDPLGSGTGSSGGSAGSGGHSGGSSGGGTSTPTRTASSPASGTATAHATSSGQAPAASASSSGQLPRTGGEPTIVAMFGLAFVIVGAGTRLALPRRS